MSKSFCSFNMAPSLKNCLSLQGLDKTLLRLTIYYINLKKLYKFTFLQKNPIRLVIAISYLSLFSQLLLSIV